ncbi:MAG: glutamate mutase L, partial [Chloroflexi bacterium]|nr:glutamate mutase L [Chloroflexota bacterium]
MKSAVVFDLSPTAVRACLLDVAEGQCRFLAAGEYPLLQFGSESVAEDALGALAEVERLTGRGMTLRASPLTPEGGDGTGADVLAAVCSPAGRLRVAVVGADAALAYDAAARAVQTAGHDLVHTMVLGDEAIRVPGALHDSLRRLGRQEPDVILFATRDDRRLDKPLAQLGAALRALEALESPPSILFSGQAGAREALDQGLKGALVLKVLPELRPEQSSENLEPCKLALAALQVERWCATLPDFARFAGWLGYRPVDRDLALRNVVRYLSTSAVAAIRVLDCAVDGLGLWSGGPTLAGYHKAALGDRALEEWLPEELPTDDVAVVTANRHLRPRTVPADARERLFWGAEVRAGAQQASEDRREP